MGENLHVAYDEVLSHRQKIFHHVAGDLFHGARMEDVATDREQQHDEGKEREDGIGCDAEGVGMDLGARHVARERDDLRAETGLLDDGFNFLDGLWRQFRLVWHVLFGLIVNDERHRGNRYGSRSAAGYSDASRAGSSLSPVLSSCFL